MRRQDLSPPEIPTLIDDPAGPDPRAPADVAERILHEGLHHPRELLPSTSTVDGRSLEQRKDSPITAS